MASDANTPARARLAITLGDPRGIGPEVVRKALADPRVRESVEPTVIGADGTECVADLVVGSWSPQGTEADAGRLSGLAIERAVRLARSGAVAGIVTAPTTTRATRRYWLRSRRREPR
jgi:4-hydroxythreonine-4-phosphate dehydrogenase